MKLKKGLNLKISHKRANSVEAKLSAKLFRLVKAVGKIHKILELKITTAPAPIKKENNKN